MTLQISIGVQLKLYVKCTILILYFTFPLRSETSVGSEISFESSLTVINQDYSPIYYRGLLLDAENPSAKYPDGRAAMATAKEFPNALSCLAFESSAETVSLADLETGKFNKIADLEICLQRVGNELGNISRFEPWLRAIGFGWTDERPASHWLSASSLGLGSEEVTVFRARWRAGDSFIGRGYPLSKKYRWADGLGAKNLVLTIVVRRQDLRVISVKAVMIFL